MAFLPPSLETLNQWTSLQGEEIPLAVQQKYSIKDFSPDTLLWIQEGECDLFMHFDAPDTWKFLSSFHTADWVLPIASHDGALSIKPNSPTLLRKISPNDLWKHFLTSENSTELFNHWAGAYIQRIFPASHRLMHTPHHVLSPNEELSLARGEIVAISKQNSHQPRLIQVKKGTVSFCGIESILLNEGDFCFLDPAVWLQAAQSEGAVLMTIVDAADLGFLQSCWKGLCKLNLCIVSLIRHLMLEQEQKDYRMILLKEQSQAEQIDDALRKIDVISGKATMRVAGRTPLLKACNIIGNKIQQLFILPPVSRPGTFSQQVYEIAVASDVSFRQVILETNWWKEEHGPLLGVIKNDHLKPIALISTGGKYRIHEPDDGSQERPIDQKKAEEISPLSWMFYRSFPRKAILSIKDVFNFCSFGRKQDYVTIGLSSLIGVILGLATPFATKILFDQVIPFLDKALFWEILSALAIIITSTTFIFLTREYTVLRMQNLINHDLDTSLWQRLLSLPAKFFKRYHCGDLIQRLTSLQELRKALSTQLIRIVLNLIFSVFFLGIMIYFSPLLSLVGVSIVILGLIPTSIFLFLSKKWAVKYQELQGKITGKVIEIIFGLSKIRTNAAETNILNCWAQDMAEAQTLRLKIGNASVNIRVVTATIDILKYLLIFVAAIALIDVEGITTEQPRLTIGDYIAFATALASFSAAFVDFSNITIDIVMLQPFWNRLKIFLDEHPEVGENRINPYQLKGDIFIEHLSFRYVQNTPFIYEDLSLHIRPGEFVAFVGPSGCGKSTLLRLIIGFETPERGSVYYDSMNLTSLNLRLVRRQMGVILQNSAIIDGSIRDNILVGTTATDEEIAEAIHLAGMEPLIKQLPMGLQTYVTVGGATLSAGERQRILLARTFLQKPSMMLWDEATNFLDEESQRYVMDNLEKLDATRIVIAHRTSAIKNADRIYVIDQGRIIDSGSYDILSKRCEFFNSLASQQT